MTEKWDGRVPLGEALQVKSVTPHTYRANLLNDYCYGSGKYESGFFSREMKPGAKLLVTDYSCAVVIHGGYLASVILRAISDHFQSTLQDLDQPDTLTLHLEYLRPATAGSADLFIADVKKGPRTSTIHINLSQGGKQKVAGYAT